MLSNIFFKMLKIFFNNTEITLGLKLGNSQTKKRDTQTQTNWIGLIGNRTQDQNQVFKIDVGSSYTY